MVLPFGRRVCEEGGPENGPPPAPPPPNLALGKGWSPRLGLSGNKKVSAPGREISHPAKNAENAENVKFTKFHQLLRNSPIIEEFHKKRDDYAN